MMINKPDQMGYRDTLWTAGLERKYPSLRDSKNNNSPLVIVGGSVSGLSTAYHLVKAGHNPSHITVVDGSIIGKAVGRSTGCICACTEPTYLDLQGMYKDEQTVRDIWQSNIDSANNIRDLVSPKGSLGNGHLRADYQPTESLQMGETYEDETEFLEEIKTRHAAGFTTAFLDQGRPGIPGFYFSMRDGEDFMINPTKFSTELAAYLAARGVEIYEDSKVTAVDKRNKTVKVGDKRLAYQTLFLTGQNVPSQFGVNKWLPPVPTIGEYVICTEPLNDSQLDNLRNTLGVLKSGETTTDVQFLDNRMLYHYGRTAIAEDSRRVLLGGTWTICYRWAEKLFERKTAELEQELHKWFPYLKGVNIEYKWYGPMELTADALPIVDKIGGVFVAGKIPTISEAMMSGKILADMYQGEQNPHQKYYSFKRKSQIFTTPDPVEIKEMAKDVVEIALSPFNKTKK